jgi:hypothetical protein
MQDQQIEDQLANNKERRPRNEKQETETNS